MNIELNHHLKLEVVSPYNLRYLRYFINKNCERESILIEFNCAVTLDRIVRFVQFLFSKDTWVRGII